MKDTVIKIENLSKKYIISHQQQKRYTTLRDVVTTGAQKIGRKMLSPFSNFNQSTTEEFFALKDVSFEIKQGDRVGIIGRNGAGKSTLLKILSRITEPSGGRVEITGRVASLLEVGTGFHAELTGRENIYLNGAILGMAHSEIKRKFDEIVAFAGVEKFLDTPVKHFSSGMYVRLAFAVAAHLEPEILIVDEVLAVGDAEFQKKCLGKMRDVATEGRTVLFVSHNMAAIRQLCSSGILLKGGQLSLSGGIDNVVEEYLQSDTGLNGCSRRTFELDRNKKLQLLSAHLINPKGDNIEVFDCDNEVIIELILNVNSIERGCYGFMQLTKNDGTIVLVSDSNDFKKHSYDNMKCGENKVLIIIPARTIGAGSYSVYFNFTDLSGNNVDSPGTVLSFCLEDLATERGNNRQGVMSTIIPWQLVR